MGGGGHESPGAGRSARGPPKAVCGSRLLCHRDPAEVSASQPCEGRQHLLASDEEICARDVAANLPARRCTGALVQGSPTLVPRDRKGLLGQEHMTRDLTGPQPNRKSLGNTESGAHQSRALIQHSAARALHKSAWANFKPATLRKLVAGMPQRVARCLAMIRGHIGR